MHVQSSHPSSKLLFSFSHPACLGFSLVLLFGALTAAQGQSTGDLSLAEILAQAPKPLGVAQEKYSTPFLVTRVIPKTHEDDTCYIEVVTNGTSYNLFANGFIGCRHLPPLEAIQWGFKSTRMRSDSIELVVSGPGERIVTASYFVKRSAPIPPDWKEDQ